MGTDSAPSINGIGRLIEEVYGPMIRRTADHWMAFDRANWILETGKPFDESAYLADRRDMSMRAAHHLVQQQERWEWVSLYCPDALRPVLELHDPFGVECEGCDPGSYAEGYAEAPCATALLVERLTVGAVDATP